jgi:hypothetical protein
VLDPGGSCLITPADNYHLKPISSEVSPCSARRPQVAQRELAALAENNAQKPFSQVRLAAYVLSDGSCVESHKSHLREAAVFTLQLISVIPGAIDCGIGWSRTIATIATPAASA